MADKQTKTTSGNTLDGISNDSNKVPASTLTPKSSEAQILHKLAHSLNDSYQLVKQRQQKYNSLGADVEPQDKEESQEDWQLVCSAKNKLKRKKQLSSSLTSVTDSVNQEKRTRIEGIQLNCRGKLQLQHDTLASTTSSSAPQTPAHAAATQRVERARNKPPLPSATKQVATSAVAQATSNTVAATTAGTAGSNVVKVAPPRLKRKLEENVQTIQKLNALTEQLRLEINELKSSLTTERGAVRVLRAQNESETRKWKNEVKKLQNALDFSKKNNTLAPSGAKKPAEGAHPNAENLPNSTAASLANYEIQRLNNEIIALKEANKALEEKKSLEELKTKERNIGQLKKELQLLQVAKPQRQQPAQQQQNKSRNATTNKTTNNKTINKPKKPNNNNTNNLPKKQKQNDDDTPPTQKEEDKDLNQAQEPNEIKKLKDLELINNTKNLQNHVNLKTTKILNHNKQQLKPLDTQNKNTHTTATAATRIATNADNTNTNINSLLKTTTMTCILQQRDFHSLPLDITECFRATTKATTTTTNTTNNTETKDNNSDSDSALSSAPPSISPQPPPAGLDTTDIWQMIRNYTTDIEKLQKDIETLQKDNEQLQTELHSAKEQILDNEKTALEASKNIKLQQLKERIQFLEEQEHQLQTESAELREQNELLEFRILELEETNDKWSLQSHANSPNANATAQQSTRDVWHCDKPQREDPMQMLFGSRAQMDSGITSPHSERQLDDDLTLLDASNEDLRRRILNMLRKPAIDEEDKQCLQQVLSLIQQLDVLSQRSGPDSLNTTSSSDEASSLDLVKSRISDYSSASSSSSARSSTHEHSSHSSKPAAKGATATNSRIVATVQPYNSSPQHQTQLQQQQQQQQPQQPLLAPTNTPTDSPRKARQPWQSNSLSESGVFVESDFLSDASEQNAGTQTDFDDEAVAHAARDFCGDLQRLQQRYDTRTAGSKTTAATAGTPYSPNLSEQKRLQYYKERLELLESKVLIYESSGDLQAKRLADRLQREIQLEKELRELQDRVVLLEQENSTLEEEKCEFEEAENDTRLRLQRLEVELEILSQRNVELEMSREALGAKYKDCRSECLILREDLGVSETQIRHLEEDKQKAKENLEFLHSTLPLLLLYSSVLSHTNEDVLTAKERGEMGNYPMLPALPPLFNEQSATTDQTTTAGRGMSRPESRGFSNIPSACQQRELGLLKDEVKCLRYQITELNARHYEAMESADSHFVDIERSYKDREEAGRAKEACLKHKIQKLQDCLRDDARAANEKIMQLEEAEKELKCCLMRISKEHRDILAEHENVLAEHERFKEEYEQLQKAQKPLSDALEQEKKNNKSLTDEINFMCKLQQETEVRNVAEMESLRTQMYDLRKEYLHIEVTNSELKEEVATLENQIKAMESSEKESVDKIRTLQDEVRSKEEMCQKLERRLEHSEGISLAHELSGSPSKRLKREEVKDLKTASTGLGAVLKTLKECDKMMPSHKQFQVVARDVKKLADTLLYGESFEEEVSNIKDKEESTEQPQEKPHEEPNAETHTEPIDGPPDPLPLDLDSAPVPVPAEVEEQAPVLETVIDEEPPVASSTSPKEQSKEEITMTVGLALVSAIEIDENVLARCPIDRKKQICEVPSELRKLSVGPAKEVCVKRQYVQDLSPVRSISRKRNILCKLRTNHERKASRSSGNSLYARVHRLTAMQAPNNLTFYDVDDVDICQPEKLRRSVSCESFHSLHDEPLELPTVTHPSNSNMSQSSSSERVDACTGTDTLRIDKETETCVMKVESSVQVRIEEEEEKFLDHFSGKTRLFLNTLMQSIPHTLGERQKYLKQLNKRWEADADFRLGLDTLQKFFSYRLLSKRSITMENYESFVSAMSCMHVLEDIFRPLKVPILQQIEDQINEELMNFHTKKMESEFYCTVYYPVKRQVL